MGWIWEAGGVPSIEPHCPLQAKCSASPGPTIMTGTGNIGRRLRSLNPGPLCQPHTHLVVSAPAAAAAPSRSASGRSTRMAPGFRSISVRLWCDLCGLGMIVRSVDRSPNHHVQPANLRPPHDDGKIDGGGIRCVRGLSMGQNGRCFGWLRARSAQMWIAMPTQASLMHWTRAAFSARPTRGCYCLAGGCAFCPVDRYGDRS